MRNRFFDLALAQASRLAGRKRRILLLLAQLGTKMKDVNWTNVRAKTIKDKFYVLGRMVKAYATGKYRDVSWRSMLLVLAMIIYFINPFDLIPDLVPLAGFTDDFAILVWVYNSVAGEVDKFLDWEASQSLSI